MKLVRLIKMGLIGTDSTVRLGKQLSDMFTVEYGLKQGGAFLSLIFNFSLQYAIRMVQVNQNGLQLNGTHQLLVYADDVNITDESVHNIQKKNRSFVSRQ
jgi:hypothetical protein